MAEQFDLVVIGTGVAGGTVASAAAAADWRVAVVDARPFGGTCALRGCEPKKVLVESAHAVELTQHLTERGALSRAARIDWPDLIRFERGFTDPVPEAKEKDFKDKGISVYHGSARFKSPKRLLVDDQELDAKHICIASGARPATLGIEGESHVISSDAFFTLSPLPESIAFIGGGYISFEFAHVAARAGAAVTVLHRGERPLAGFDPDLADGLLAATRGLGADVRLGSAVTAVEPLDDGYRVHTADGKHVEVGCVVHGAGRVPALEGLDLKAGKVDNEAQGVQVKATMQSVSNPAVYAAGDAAAGGGMPLTPVAALEANAVVRNLVHGERVEPNYAGVPSVTFTVPALARVGMLKSEARQHGLHVRAKQGDSSGWRSSTRIGNPHAGYKILIDENDGERIVGAHLFGPGAEETINIFALAIRHGLTVSQLKDMAWSFPTAASDISAMLS